MSRKRAVVGVDLGGTSLIAAVVDDQKGRVLGEAKLKTQPEAGLEGVLGRIQEAVGAAIKDSGIRRRSVLGVGIGVPGPVDAKTGVVVRCPNLGAGWDSAPIAARLGQLLDLPVTVDNDVNVGAVGEHRFGAGRGTRDMLAIFVGTGIGGGLILGGKLHGGLRNSAGEVGHMVVLDGGARCGCGEHGHAEGLASRSAIERDILAAMQAGRESSIPQLLRAANRTALSAGVIGDALEAGDRVTMEAVGRAQHYLGILVSACINLLDPERVVLGGGVLERMGEDYLSPVRRIAWQHLVNKEGDAERCIVRATLGDHSGVMGAAVLARQRLRDES